MKNFNMIDDLTEPLRKAKMDAVVYNLDWTVETIISQLQQGNVVLSPKFQRRDAWREIRKSQYIESLLIGLPVPQIVLVENEQGKYFILDGKQRTLSLLQFTGNIEGKYNNFKLKGLEVRTDLEGVTYKKIKANPDLEIMLNHFMSHSIQSVVIKECSSIEFLHRVFVRFNAGNLPLSPQELRQALFPGQFVEYIDEAASHSASIKILLKIEEPDFRMRDVELFVRYIAFAFFLDQYAGDLKDFLDMTCDHLNKNWDYYEQKVKFQIEAFEKAIQAGVEIFGENQVGRKWMGKQYDRRFNKAVVDIMAFYLSDERIRHAALEKKEVLVKQFKSLCETNQKFKDAIVKTTNSLGATTDRLKIWGETLKQITGLNFSLPEFKETRILFNGFWVS